MGVKPDARLYPCPLLHMWSFEPFRTSRRNQQRFARRHRLEQMVNVLVCALNHIALGFPSTVPQRGRYGLPLSIQQWGLVGTVTSRLQSMRRRPTSGACSASLQNLAHHGSDFEKLLNAFDLIPYSRLRTTAHDGGAATGEGKCMGRPGPLISTRIDLPECLQQFDPAPFLCADSLAALLSPDCLLMDDELLPPALPRGKLAGQEELLKLGKRWDSIGRCKLVKIGEVDERDVGGRVSSAQEWGCLAG